jgi:ubiquitin carboxyl-terminal hydrolase 22/27/51
MEIDMYPYTNLTSLPRDLEKDRIPSFMYWLSCVVIHKGKPDSGHYVCYCREGDDWFLFDDNKVVLSTEADVLAAEAYLLFYCLKSFPVD